MKKILIMPIGIPGCGKSVWTRQVSERYAIRYVASDEIREQLYGDEAIQGSFTEVFNEVYRQVRENLKNWNVCILDATNISYFARGEAIKRSGADEIWYVVMDNDLERAKRQNRKRERYCPEYVIERMFNKFYNEYPNPQEGKMYRRTIPIKLFYYTDKSLYWKMERL